MELRRVLFRSPHNANDNASARILRIVQVISAIHEVDVYVVNVVPIFRPGVNEPEPKAAVLEARISANHPWTADAESMLAPKIGTESLVWYATFASVTES